jgi:predicted Zn-dependent peptidase
VFRRSDHHHALRLFAEILGGGRPRGCSQRVREERGLCYAIDAYCTSYEDVGVLGVDAGTSAQDARPAAALIVETLARLSEDVTEVELARARAQARAGLHMGREQLAGTGRAGGRATAGAGPSGGFVT